MGRMLLGLFMLFFSFFFDIFFHATHYAPFSYLTLTLFYGAVCVGSSPVLIAGAALGVLMQAFLVQGIFGAGLTLMVPLGLLVTLVRRHTEQSFFLIAFFVLLCLITHFLFLSLLYGTRSTPSVIMAHFVIALGMIYLLRGSQGNRS